MDINIRIPKEDLEKETEESAFKQSGNLLIILLLINIVGSLIDYQYNNTQWFFLIQIRLGVCFAALLFFFIFQLVQGKSLFLYAFLFLMGTIQYSYFCCITSSLTLFIYFSQYAVLLLIFSFLIFLNSVYYQLLNGISAIVFVMLFQVLSALSFLEILLNGGLWFVGIGLASLYLQARYYKMETERIKTLMIANKSKSHLYQQNAEIKNQKTEIETKNEELKSQNEMISSQKAELETAYSHITDSILYAQRIQNAILSNEYEGMKGFKDGFVFYKAKDIVAGDFYWFSSVEISKTRKTYSIFIAADCTGHGVPGAFMTLLGITSLNEIINERKVIMPGDILEKLDRKILETLQTHQDAEQINDGMDISVLVFDEEEEKVFFAGAKLPLYVIKNAALVEYKGSKFPVGSNQYKEGKVFETHEIAYQKDMLFYIFSDGFQDQFGGPEGKKYMKPHFRDLLLQISNARIDQQKIKLENELNQWKGNLPQTDDVLVIGIKV